MKKNLAYILSLSFLFISLVHAHDKEVTIVILGTSDLHGRIFPWDYAHDEKDTAAGYLKIASVVKETRAQYKNVILVDAGDTIEGNYINLFHREAKSPIIEVMNDIGYDTWTLGNHEFNFGLEILERAVKTSHAMVLGANIYSTTTGKRVYDAYKISTKDGINIAVIGMITPNIPRWEGAYPDHYVGLEFKNPVEETKKVLEELQGKADVVVGAFHIGLDTEYSHSDGVRSIIETNPRLDVVVSGHAHRDIPGITIGTTLVVDPSYKGERVSKIVLKLRKKNEEWKIVEKASENIDTRKYAADTKLEKKYEWIHLASRQEANKIIAEVSQDFLKKRELLPGISLLPLQDNAINDLINTVELYFTKADIASSSLFKSDMNIKKGAFKNKDIINIYKYPNTLIAAKISGKKLKKYMEWSARYFNTYKPGDVTISFDGNIRHYNYDMFSGVTYEIDISQEPGKRIKNLNFQGKPVTDDMTFTIAMNNYRFGALAHDGYLEEKDKVFDSLEKWPDATMQTLIAQYVREKKVIEPKVDNNWKIVGADLDHPMKEKIYSLVRARKIHIPHGENDSFNTQSLNVFELEKQGLLD